MSNGDDQGTGSRPDAALFLPSLAGGGAERVTLNLARGLAEKGLRVDLVVPNATGELEGQVPEGVNLVGMGGLRTLQSVPKLIDYLRRVRPRALLSAMNHANVAAAWAAKLARFRGRLVLAEHVQLPPGSASLWQRAFNLSIGISYRFADAVVAVSQGVKQSLVKNAGVNRDRIVVIFNPVIADGFDRQGQHPVPSLLAELRGPVFLGIGRLEPQKNLSLLLRSFADLRQRRNAQLVILGEGSERPKLEALAEELGVQEDVYMPGFVSDPYAYMAHSQAFVLSSDWEGLPTVLIEALAVGAQVVSTDCPSGPHEILAAGKYGRLVPMRDAAALSEAMEAALDEPLPQSPDDWIDQFRGSTATANYLRVLALEPPRVAGP